MSNTFLAESYSIELTEDAMRTRVDRVAAVTQALPIGGLRVALLGCLLIPDDEVCFWRFTGASLALVERAGRQADLDIQRIARSIDITHGGRP